MTVTRLEQQLRFILEIDKLKSIQRRSTLINGERRENSAEHSWHITVMAMTLAEYANEEVDMLRTIQMLLIHDIVEIDAGDTFAYDTQGRQSQAEREQAAAEHLFGLLPADQAAVYIALWHEFEAAATAEAKLANAVDRLMPLLHNYYNDGGTWRENSVNRARVEERVGAIEAGSTTLWSVAQQVLDEAVTKGYLRNANQEESGQA